jgi:4-diphosphocytidyl-2-C-methyl-D-erythritol kinase
VTGPAPAKINLALVVGPLRGDGKHEVLTVLQRVDLADRISVEPAGETKVTGYEDDTLVRRALGLLGAAHGWRVHIRKRVPVASGLGGGSSDAATALRLANEQLREPLDAASLHRLAAQVGADVPFFLADGPQLGGGDGSELEPLELPQDFVVLLVLPRGVQKASTAAVYDAFDAANGSAGFDERAARLRAALAATERPRDLAALPANDLASSPLAGRLRELGSFRADVSGAGPTVYGLFHRHADAERARAALRGVGRTWIAVPAWYG